MCASVESDVVVLYTLITDKAAQDVSLDEPLFPFLCFFVFFFSYCFDKTKCETQWSKLW